MTAPPTSDRDLTNGMRAVRHALQDVLDSAPAVAREEAKTVLDSDALARRVVQIVLPIMDLRFRRKYYRQIVLGVGGLLIMIFLLGGLAFNQMSAIQQAANVRFATQDSALQRSESTIAAFKAQLDASNAKLVSQGLPPVQGPVGTVQPGTPDQAKLINAAATASTLASLPQAVIQDASTAQLADAAAKAVADYFALNPSSPVGPSPQQVIDGLAAYFANNPVPAGPRGEQGPQGAPGPPPTAEQITEAFKAALQDNPQLLCPLGGVYGSETVLLVGGQTKVQFGCFADPAPPPPGPSIVPPPPTTTPATTTTPPPDTTTVAPTTTTARPATTTVVPTTMPGLLGP